MTRTLAQPPPPAPARRYATFVEWWQNMGSIPLERIIMNPWIGTATEVDLLRLVDKDKRLCELIDGTLVEKPLGAKESLIAGILLAALNNFVLPRKLGYVTGEAGPFRLRQTRVRLPDVGYIGARDLPNQQLPNEAILSVSPAIAAEVINDGNTRGEMRQKMEDYFDSGTRLVWLIYPQTRTVHVYTELSDEPAKVLGEQDLLDGGEVLPGFTLPISDLFASLADPEGGSDN